MQYKDNVEHDQLHPELVEILPFVELTYGTVLTEVGVLPREMVMTSGHEGGPGRGVHAKGSKHYIQNNPSGYGEAVDLRCNDIEQTLATEIAGRIAQQLRLHYPKKYKVFLENCLKPTSHIHIQLSNHATENA